MIIAAAVVLSRYISARLAVTVTGRLDGHQLTHGRGRMDGHPLAGMVTGRDSETGTTRTVTIPAPFLSSSLTIPKAIPLGISVTVPGHSLDGRSPGLVTIAGTPSPRNCLGNL
jgi:hypothetical protein